MPSNILSSSSSPYLSKAKKPFTSNSTTTNHHHHRSSASPLFCRHYPTATATLDLLILILVLFSGTFLLTSYFSYIFNSLSLLLPPLFLSHSSIFHHSPLLFLLGFLTVFTLVALCFFVLCVGSRSWKCGNPNCKGMKKAMEFDLQLQTEEGLKSGPNEADRLPWKGGSEANPGYECLRAELRKMAPPNGRAVLLFRERCGCPVAKLIGWGPKKGRRHKKALTNLVPDGVDHHR